MASIQKRDNGRWRARYRDDAGREHARHFQRKVDAQHWLNEVTAAVVTGQYVDPTAGRTTFKAYAADWRQSQVSRPSTLEVIDRALIRVNPIIGDRPLVSFTPDVIQAMVSLLSQTLAPSTVHVTYSYVSTIFKSAVRSRMVARTPCDGIKLPEIQKSKVVPLTVAEVLRIADNAPDYLRAQVILAAGTGLRQGEVLGLTVDRVNFLKRTITVDRQLTTLNGESPEFGPPKRESSVREVPLPDSVGAELAAHVARFPAGPEGLIFTGPRGAPFRRSTHWSVWKRTVTAAGLPDVTFHDLRHHYASLLIHHGESVKTVQNALGHKSAQETLDTYAHLWPGSDERTRAAVDAAYSQNLADSLRTAQASGGLKP